VEPVSGGWGKGEADAGTTEGSSQSCIPFFLKMISFFSLAGTMYSEISATFLTY
jgi:hypothetical protein